MPKVAYSVFAEFIREIIDLWESWGADFKVDGLTKSDAEALSAAFEAKEREIVAQNVELSLLRADRDAMAKRIETLGVRARLAVLANFPADSPEALNVPVFGRKRSGRPTQRAVTLRQTAKNKREARENAAREALKAELRAELEQEKARLD